MEVEGKQNVNLETIIGAEEALPDYEDVPSAPGASSGGDKAAPGEPAQGSYVAATDSNFSEFLLDPRLNRALTSAGFEHPSEVQFSAIPHALAGKDLLCQAKSGMGKTAIFVLSVLNLLRQEPKEEGKKRSVRALVIAHTRELAFQIKNEFQRFCQYMPHLRYAVFYGGTPIEKDIELLAGAQAPDIVIGTPGRLKGLIDKSYLRTDAVERFVLDECDQCLENLRMRDDIQHIIFRLPRNRQSMFFTATLPTEVKITCLKFLRDPQMVCVDEANLTLDGLSQYHCNIADYAKVKKLFELLDGVQFDQVVVFVANAQRADSLKRALTPEGFPAECIFGRMEQEQRIATYQRFKKYETRILVATDIFGRGIDIERVNLVVNYDMPPSPEQYLHRVGRAGRFGTTGIAVSFFQPTAEEAAMLDAIQTKFETKIEPLPQNLALLNKAYATARSPAPKQNGA